MKRPLSRCKGGGLVGVEAQTTTSVKTVKKQGVVNNKKDLNILGL